MYDIITIGSATRDAFFKVNYKIVPWARTPAGKAYLLPLGEKLEVDDIFFTIGGNAVNASVTFARQGFKTACTGKLGCDVSGEELKRRLRKEGVGTKFLVCTPKLPTAYSVLLLQEGSRTILNHHGSSHTFSFRDIHLKKLRSRWWYLSLSGKSDKMFKGLVRFARDNKIAVAFNPSGHHLRRRRDDILTSLNDLSLLVLNEEEAALLTGISFKKEKDVFKKLDRLMPGILAVTNGRGGVTVSDGRFIYKTGIFKEKRLVDRTGAGDAFGSGFTAGLMHRGINLLDIPHIKPADISYAIRLATANSASVVEHLGASEGTLTKGGFENPRWRKLRIRIRRL